MKRIAVFVSGEGTNAENLVKYFRRDGGRARVALIVTNRQSAPVVERARRLGVECVTISRDDFAAGQTIVDLLAAKDIDFVVLAGFLLMIPPCLIERYRGRIVNIHPALLPKFGGKGMYGMRVHEAVVAAGERETGITIHHVNDRYDDGTIIFQAAVEVSPDDSAGDVAAKVRALEEIHFAGVIDGLV